MSNVPSPNNFSNAKSELPEQDPCCQGTCDLPWIDHSQCMTFEETRIATIPLEKLVTNRDIRGVMTVRVVYAHSLCLVGKQMGGLVYTLTLLPGETATLFHSDRHRRTTTEDQRFSVATTFAKFTNALYQNRKTEETNEYNQVLTDKVDASVSGRGTLMPFKLAAKASGSFSSSSTETAEGFSASTASDVFVSIAQQASQSTEMKRSITVSTFEDKETIETTKRVLHNANKCYAVNYFVRRVLDVYEVSTKIVAVTFEIESRQLRFGPISIDQIDQLPSPFGAAVKAAAKQFPTVGERTQEPKRVSVPTDGVVYLPELAHCCAQDPALEAATLIALEREKAEAQKAALEVQLMALEVQRRQALLAAGTLDPFVPAAIAAPA